MPKSKENKATVLPYSVGTTRQDKVGLDRDRIGELPKKRCRCGSVCKQDIPDLSTCHSSANLWNESHTRHKTDRQKNGAVCDGRESSKESKQGPFPSSRRQKPVLPVSVAFFSSVPQLPSLFLSTTYCTPTKSSSRKKFPYFSSRSLDKNRNSGRSKSVVIQSEG